MADVMKQPKIRPDFFQKAMEFTWLAIIFLVPLFFNPSSNQVFVLNKALLLQFLTATMLAFWVADWFLQPARRRPMHWHDIWANPLTAAVIVFGFITIVATIFSLTPAVSFWGSYYRKAGLLNLLCWLVFFLILSQQVKTRTQIFRAIYALLISSALVSITGIIQYFLPQISSTIFNWPYKGRVFSTLGNPLFLSGFLAMVIPLNLAMIVYTWNRKKRAYDIKLLAGLIVLLLLQFWCLWVAQYSITILLYVISAVLFLLLWGIVKRQKVLLGVGAGITLCLFIIAGFMLLPLLFRSPPEESAGNTATGSTISEEVGLQSLGWRVQFWQSTVELLSKTPEVPFSNDRLGDLRKLIGYGPETFIVTFQQVFPDKLKSDYTYQGTLVDRPHNDYLYLATTVGVLGLLSFLSILGVFFFLCFRYLRKARDDFDKLLLVAIVAAVVQYMADIFFNLSTIAPELVFWLILALTAVLGRSATVIPHQNQNTTSAEKLQSARRDRLFVAAFCSVALIIAGLLIAARPFVADIYYEKGQKLQSQFNPDAANAYEKATEVYPDEVNYWRSLAAYTDYAARNIPAGSAQSQVLSMSLAAYTRSQELRPYIAFEYYWLGDVLTYWAKAGYSQKWPEALLLYDKANGLFPDNAVILDKWGLALILKGDFNEAWTKLEQASVSDPDWAQTNFLSGLLLALEGHNNESSLEITSPIKNDSANLDYFIDLCFDLIPFNTIRPINAALNAQLQSTPDEWSTQAAAGITELFIGNPKQSVSDLNSAMLLVPDGDLENLLEAIVRLSMISPNFRTELGTVAEGWRDRINQNQGKNLLLPLLNGLIENAK